MEKEKTKKNTVKLPAEGKPNIEGLMQELSRLSKENEMLKNTLNRAASQLESFKQRDLFAKLDWCWRVITLEHAASIFGDDFYDACVNEFKEIMTPEEEERKE